MYDSFLHIKSSHLKAVNLLLFFQFECLLFSLCLSAQLEFLVLVLTGMVEMDLLRLLWGLDIRGKIFSLLLLSVSHRVGGWTGQVTVSYLAQAPLRKMLAQFFVCVQHLLCEIVLYSRFIILASIFFLNVGSARVSFQVNKKIVVLEE